MPIGHVLAFHIAMTLVFLVPPNIHAQTYKVLHYFDGSDGTCPRRLVLSGTTLYGAATSGGISNNGSLFMVNTDGSDFTVLKSFTGGADGCYPYGALLLAGTTLYGTASYGGDGGGGMVFKLNTDGAGFQVFHSFTQGSGAYAPEAGLVQSGDTLYGTTELSGAETPGYGAVFRVNTDGSNYQVLRILGTSDGANPRAELLLSGSTLFGTTSGHAYPGNGTIFKLNTDGSGFTILKELAIATDIYRLFSPLVLSDDTLYGTACQDNYYGVVFKISTDGSGFSVLQTITNIHGAWAWPGLAGLAMVGSTLYATSGGSPNEFRQTNNCGTVFQVNTDGSGYTVLKNFTFTDGANPGAAPLVSGGTLYGTTGYGGISNNGVVFAFGYPPDLLDSPKTQTAEEGSPVRLAARVTGSQPLACQWLCNGAPVANTGTNTSLAFAGIQTSQVGSYVAIITNLFGAVTSSPAMLSVVAPVPRTTVPAVSLTGDVGSCLHLGCADTVCLGTSWQELGAVTLASTQRCYADLTEPLPTSRFYRAWQTNVSGMAPALQMILATELTLTGVIGGNMRVDYINQIGPTGAWVTLDNIALTNATQPYFDFTAFRQPARLYRLMPVP